VAYKVLAPFKRSHTSHSPDPARSNSSISLTTGIGTPPVRRQQPGKTLLSEAGVIRRKLSIILTRQRDPNPHVKDRPRPLSIVSIGSSSPHSQQSNSIRSLHTAAESISSRAARVEPSISTATESSMDAPAPAHAGSGPRHASVYSGASTVPDGADEPSTTTDPAAASPLPLRFAATLASASAPAGAGGARDTHRTRRGRGESKGSSGNCAVQ
jgi:hypothetical protein